MYKVEGQAKVDLEGNGCVNEDENAAYLEYKIDSDANSGYLIGDGNGNYKVPINLTDVAYTITPQLENPEYFTVSPENFTVSFPTNQSPYEQDICITPTATAYNDLEVVVIPLGGARPGFEVDYLIQYKNKGNQTLSGTVNLSYPDEFMIYKTSNPTPNTNNAGSLSWAYADLTPLQTGEVQVSFTLNPPTHSTHPLNSNDLLNYTATITPTVGDETEQDNTFTLNQTVVNSFDPNDKICLEGEVITPDLIGEYVHYLIRFENLGTAEAVNVVVKDVINTEMFDVSTLVPINASHAYQTRIVNGNEVELIFEDINLPFDDANNDGYITFKIKTLDMLTVGGELSNKAEIYFDFNFPVITEEYITTIEENLSTIEFTDGSKVLVYPNPATEKVYIETEDKIEQVELYSSSGKIIKQSTYINGIKETTIDLMGLPKGIYTLKIETLNGVETQQFIKQ